MTQPLLQDPLREAKNTLLECSQTLRAYLQLFAQDSFLPHSLFPQTPAIPQAIESKSPPPSLPAKEKKRLKPEKPLPSTKAVKPQQEDLSDIAKHMQAHFPQNTWHKSPLQQSPQSSSMPPCYLYLSLQQQQHPFFQNLTHTLSFYFTCNLSLPPNSPPDANQALTLLPFEMLEHPSWKGIVDFPVIPLKHPDTYCKFPQEKKKLWQTLYPHLPPCLAVTLQK